MTRIKIQDLTEAQRRRFPEFVEKWTNIGLCTSSADRPTAEEGARLAYQIAGLKPPEKIVWCGSPLSQGLTRAIIFDLKDQSVRASVGDSVRASVWDSVRASVWDSVGDSVGDSVRDSVWDSVRASVWDSVWDSVRASVWDSVRASVGDSVGDSVRDSVWDSVRASVWDSVWDSVRASVWDSVRASVWDSVGDSVRASVWDSVRASVRASVRDSVGDSVRASVGDSVGDSVRASVWDSVRASVWDSVGDSVRASVRASVGDSVGDSVRASVRASVWDSGYGQHDAHWLAFYEYFRKACSLSKETQKLVGLWQIAKSAGWWLPHGKICWISERHNVLRRDSQGRLHCDSGPALAYPDGWAIHAWHGVRVAARVVERSETIAVQEIETEANAEVRRVLIERYGPSRYLFDSGAEAIHTDDWGTLYRKEVAGDEPLVMVRVVNSTPEPDGSGGKPYFLRVPPTMTRAKEAVSWTFGKTEGDYAPAQQT